MHSFSRLVMQDLESVVSTKWPADAQVLASERAALQAAADQCWAEHLKEAQAKTVRKDRPRGGRKHARGQTKEVQPGTVVINKCFALPLLRSARARRSSWSLSRRLRARLAPMASRTRSWRLAFLMNASKSEHRYL